MPEMYAKPFTLVLIAVIYEVFQALILCQDSSLGVSWQFKLVCRHGFYNVSFVLSHEPFEIPSIVPQVTHGSKRLPLLLFLIREEWNEPQNVCKRAALISFQL